MNHETHERGERALVVALGLAVLLAVPGPALAAPATGPLRVCPSNPRHFADASGLAIYLAGSHTSANFSLRA